MRRFGRCSLLLTFSCCVSVVSQTQQRVLSAGFGGAETWGAGCSGAMFTGSRLVCDCCLERCVSWLLHLLHLLLHLLLHMLLHYCCTAGATRRHARCTQMLGYPFSMPISVSVFAALSCATTQWHQHAKCLSIVVSPTVVLASLHPSQHITYCRPSKLASAVVHHVLFADRPLHTAYACVARLLTSFRFFVCVHSRVFERY